VSAGVTGFGFMRAIVTPRASAPAVECVSVR